MTGILNNIFGVGGILTLTILLLNHFLNKSKRKLDEAGQDVIVNQDATKSMQEAYKLFVGDSKDKAEILIKNIKDLTEKFDVLEKRFEEISALNKQLKSDYEELRVKHSRLQTSYTILKKDYEEITRKYFSLKIEYSKLKDVSEDILEAETELENKIKRQNAEK